MIYLSWFILPVLISILVTKLYSKGRITQKELLYLVGIGIVSALMATGIVLGTMYSGSFESNLIHGQVNSKSKEWTSCEHEYVCGQSCSTDSKGNSSCTPIYCDEHTNDWDWVVDTSVGRITIDRIDRRGTREPPRWTEVKIGEPATNTVLTSNYLKAMPDSVLVPPKVPITTTDKEPKIFDYYRINLVDNHTKFNFSDFNPMIRDWLRVNGVIKQVSPWVIITDDPSPAYADSVFYSVAGGAKNSIILIFGIDEDQKVRWFKANTFALGMGNSVLLAKLQSAALGNVLNNEVMANQLSLISTDFKRVSNSEFKELFEGSITANPWIIAIVLLLQMGVNIYFSILFHKEDFV